MKRMFLILGICLLCIACKSLLHPTKSQENSKVLILKSPDYVDTFCVHMHKEIEDIWAYNQEKKIYILKEREYYEKYNKRGFFEIYNRCFLEMDTSQIIRLLGKPSVFQPKTKLIGEVKYPKKLYDMIIYDLNNHCHPQLQDGCSMLMVSFENDKIVEIKVSGVSVTY